MFLLSGLHHQNVYRFPLAGLPLCTVDCTLAQKAQWSSSSKCVHNGLPLCQVVFLKSVRDGQERKTPYKEGVR